MTNRWTTNGTPEDGDRCDSPLNQDNHAQQQATEQAFKDPQDMAREILSILPQVVAVLPADEVYRHLSQLGPFLV